MRTPRILIGATGSGSGKTTITCALLEILKRQGKKVQAFKCGPDYIDPMFHRTVLGIPSKNLDTFFTGEKMTAELFMESAVNADISVMEGVMGLYDGLGGIRKEGSAYDLATVTDTPVILVIDAHGMGRSILPLIAGFLSYDTIHLIRGIILNRTSGAFFETIRPEIEKSFPVEVLGYFPNQKEILLESRHLGLKRPEEVEKMAELLAKTADIAAAMTCEAQLGILSAFDPEVHALRGQQGQMRTAQNLLRLLDGSRLAFAHNPEKVQDAYSIRCVPQIHGASRDAIRYVWDIVSREINAVTDNPLIFPEEDKVISGGNFHGQPVALAMDFLGIALSEYANVSERRLERMVNPALSNGLPAFLTKYGGVHSGFMITQYAAASMVSENKVYAHPASVDSIPSSANQEDHVSMGTTAARKARMILDNSQKVVGIELLAAAQALWLRGESLLAPATAAVYQKIRQTVPPVDTDVVMYPQMAELDRLVKSGALLEAAEQVCGRLL